LCARPAHNAQDEGQEKIVTDNKPPASNTILNPPGWPQPKGYANGIKARGQMVFVGGMIGWDIHGKLAQGFVAQTRQLLENIVAVLKEGGAGPEHVVRMTWYVVDIDEYRNCLPELGKVYRDVMGRNFPAMALVEVKSLVEREARLEIETTAVIPD
jgi:enamine deaminase RidA (YjgF/YER057c/UK114 family)